jgi:hypothetical protein
MRRPRSTVLQRFSVGNPAGFQNKNTSSARGNFFSRSANGLQKAPIFFDAGFTQRAEIREKTARNFAPLRPVRSGIPEVTSDYSYLPATHHHYPAA